MPETFEHVGLRARAEPRLRVLRRSLDARATSALTLAPDAPGTLVASTESWETIGALNPDELPRAEAPPAHGGCSSRRKRVPPTGMAAELVLAADQFIITPAGRVEEAARARAIGDEVRTVIAGYHWFTDWGRDTMISLEGLTLCTGRQREAGYILRTFGHYVRDGLIPNMFPEGTKEGLYHTADATLWFFHAIHRYLLATGDRSTLRQLLPKLKSIVEHHVARHALRHRRRSRATACCGRAQEGYQLTWMDAKVDDWVVTPRRGKAVEINALWYNALSPAGRLAARGRRSGGAAGRRARRARARVVQRALLVRARAATSTTSSTASRATTRRAGRTRSSRSRSTIRCSIARAGSRSSTSCATGC